MLDYWRYLGRAQRVAAAMRRDAAADGPGPFRDALGAADAFVLVRESRGKGFEAGHDLEFFLWECGMGEKDARRMLANLPDAGVARVVLRGCRCERGYATLGFGDLYDGLVASGLASPRPRERAPSDFESFVKVAARWENEGMDLDFDAKDQGELRRLLRENDSFVSAWTVDGREGGGIDSDASHFAGTGERRGIGSLEDVLRLTYVRFADLDKFAALERRGEETWVGYYGNQTTYGFKHVPFTEAYDTLADLGFVEPRHEASPAPR